MNSHNRPAACRWRARSAARRAILPLVYVFAGPVAAAGQDPAQVLLHQGNALLDQGRFGGAVAAYTRALELNRQYAKAYYNRALANEMVDRQAAIRDWEQFVERAINNPDLSSAVGHARERLRLLQGMPAPPDSLKPTRYVASAKDYYAQIAEESQGLQWTKFPVAVFVADPPGKWQEAMRKALETWGTVIPLELTHCEDTANIVLRWVRPAQAAQRSGWEKDLVQVRTVDGKEVGRSKTAFVSLSVSRRWSDYQMRSTLLHEMGHALGIRGHSDRERDVMFPTMEEGVVRIVTPLGLRGGVVSSRSLVNKPSTRDVNTLIRLYNCPGLLAPLR